jgi:hypothetical protein
MYDGAHDFRIGEIGDVAVAGQGGIDQLCDIDTGDVVRHAEDVAQAKYAATLSADFLAERPGLRRVHVQGEAGVGMQRLMKHLAVGIGLGFGAGDGFPFGQQQFARFAAGGAQRQQGAFERAR